MSRIAFIDNKGVILSAVWAVKNEGHDVMYLSTEKDDDVQKVGVGLTERVGNIADIIKWRPDVCVTYNSSDAAARLARETIPTWGSSFASEELEKDRLYASGIAKQFKVGVVPKMYRFGSVKEAQKFLGEDKGRSGWVFKAEGGDEVSTSTTHVTESTEELEAVIEFESERGAKSFVLQQQIDGIEISVEGWYDYRIGWLAPFNSTLERKRLFAGDKGPMTGCMGSIVWPWRGQEPALPKKTIMRLEPHLKSIKYVGPIDGNFIIDYKTREPNFLEYSPRLGWSAFEALMTMGGSWGDFFIKLGRGEAHGLPIGGGFGCAVDIFCPAAKNLPLQAPLRYEHRIYPKEIWSDNGQLKAVGTPAAAGLAQVFTAASQDRTIKQAMAEIYEDVIPQIVVPDIAYRTDVGERAERDVELLEEWGYNITKEIRSPRMIGVVAVDL